MASMELSAKQEKDDRIQKMKQEISEMVKLRISHTKSKVCLYIKLIRIPGTEMELSSIELPISPVNYSPVNVSYTILIHNFRLPLSKQTPKDLVRNVDY